MRENGAALIAILRRFATRIVARKLSWGDAMAALLSGWIVKEYALGVRSRKYALGIRWRKLRSPVSSFVTNSPATIQALLVAAFAALALLAHFKFELSATVWWIALFSSIPIGRWASIMLKRWAARWTDAAGQPLTPARGGARYIAALAFIAPFLGAVYFLNSYDISHNAYFVGGNDVIFSSISKTILCFYFFVLFHSAGFLFVSLPYLSGITERLAPLERFLLCSFIGMGLLTVILFIIAAAGALSLPLVLGVSAPLVLAGYSQFAGLARNLRAAVSRRIRADEHGISQSVVNAEVILFFFLFLFVLLVRGLIPGNLSYDEVAHYQPYIQTVIENGGIRFNEYWYHFYVSKGAGLFFLGALLGDIHTPLTISFAAFALAGLFLGYLVHRATGAMEWTLLSVIIYFVAAPLPGYEVFLRLNLMSGGLVAGVALSLLLLRDIPIKHKAHWAIACLPIYLGLMVLTPTSAAFLVPLLAIYFIADITRWRLLNALDDLIWGVASVTTVVAILTFNYIVTGLAEGTPLRMFFSFADQFRLNEFVSPYLIVFIEEASSRDLGQLDLRGLFQPNLDKVAYILQTQRYAFMFAGGSLFWVMVLWVGGARLAGRRTGGASFDCLWPGLIFIAIAVAMAHVNQQDQSVLRFLFSTKIFIIAFAVVLWKVAIELLPQFRVRHTLEVMVVAIFVAGALQIMFTQIKIHHRYPYYFQYLAGEIGVMESHKAMSGDRGIWPVCLEARDLTGPDDKLLHMSVTIESGACHMMPGRAFRLEFGNGFGGLWHNMVFSEDPRESVRWFRKAGINYFLFDPGQPLFGCTAYSAAFRPENIGRYLTVAHGTYERRYEEGYILTWREPEDPPIPDEFISDWRKHLARDQPWQMGEMCQRVGRYFQKYGLRVPVRQDLSLSPLRSWQ